MRRMRFVLAALAIASVWVSPACKSNEVNQTSNTTNNYRVGPSGATFDGPDGTKLRIPAGAVDREVDIVIREATPGEYPKTEGPYSESGKLKPWNPVGKVWAFEPHGLKFFLDVTAWLPAPAGRYSLMRAQPGGNWEEMGGNEVVDGKFEFTTKSFSFYTLWDYTTTNPLTPCQTCREACKTRCSEEPVCMNNCWINECSDECTPTDADTKDDAKPGADTSVEDTSTCAPPCPSTIGEGSACTPCATTYACTAAAKTGGGDLKCDCDPSGTWKGCVPVSSGSDAGTDTSGGICPTMTQPEGTATFSAFTPASAYAFYKPNLSGSTYYSQLWLVLSDKPGVCTQAVSGQAAANGKILRIRLETPNTTTPTVYTTGTYAAGGTYGVIGMGEQTNSACNVNPGDDYSNGTIVITEASGGHYKGTFSFPAGISPAANGTFDVPTCAAEGMPGGGTGDPSCCK